ncbi:MAG: adenylate/guanylate cyclase domain-containing protein [Actinomycetota bacterium]
MSGIQHDRTYVFSDIVDSTRLWETAGDLMPAQLEAHDAIMHAAFERHGGAVFSTMGDGFGVAFERAEDGVAAMLDAQAALLDHPWPDDCVIRARMGANSGRAHFRGDDYFGPPVNLAARVMAAGHGGQVLISADTMGELPRPPADTDIEALGEHRLKGVAQPVPLFGVLGEGLEHRFAPLRVLEVGRFTIPAPPNPIVGRAAEVDELLGALRTQRCTTIVAAGGAGKTRLAIEVAAGAVDLFPAGVHVVELAASDVIDDLATRVAELALGPEPTAGPDDHLRRLTNDLDEPVLVVVDNAEHVIDDCALEVERLLRTTPDLTFLVTSREPLRIAGEHTFNLSPLSTTPTSDGRSPALDLFVDRARAQGMRGDLPIDVIETLVQRLDGLPLALELAAAQVAVVGAEMLLANLEEALATAPPRRGADTRHRTVEAAIDWSFRRCDPTQQRLLTRLSVFPGTFDLDAAVGVCADDDLSKFAVLQGMTSLVDQSLVAADDGPAGRRFRLLQLIRGFALDRLDDRAGIERRHSEHFLAVGKTVAPAIGGDTPLDAAADIAADHENFIAVLERGVERDDHRATARRLAVRLQSYWEDTGRLRQGADWLTALSEPHDIGDRAWAACTLVGTTYDAMCGLTPLGRTPLESIRQFADLGVPGAHAMQMTLAFVDLSQGRLISAIERFDRAAGDFVDDPPNAWQALLTAGALADYRGDPATAQDFYQRADEFDQTQLGAWAGAYRDVFVTGSRLGELGVDAAESDVDELLDAWLRLHRTGLETRITIAGHRVLWALEQAGRDDLVAEWLMSIIAYPNRTGYRWFTLALADLTAALAVRHGRPDLGLPIEGAVDEALAEAEFGFPETFMRRREAAPRVAVDPEDAERLRQKGTGVTIAGLTDMVEEAVALGQA